MRGVAEDSTDERLDRLYAASLDDFTGERDALAAELRAEGEGERAAEVKRLRKPSVPAWALNQASRRSPGQTAALIEAGEELRDAQGSLADRGGRERLVAAQRRERELVRELAKEAEVALRDAGRPLSAAAREQIEETLHAAALDSELGALVARGRLERPGVAVGFPGTAPAPAKGESPRKGAAAERRKRETLAKRLRREQERLAEAADKREAAERTLTDAERAAAAAARELDRARHAARAASEAEVEAAARVETLRDDLESA
jgi:hypothetical protein